jgi:AmpE protein
LWRRARFLLRWWAEGINTLDCLWELLLRSAVLWYAGFALWTVLIH